MIEVNCISGSVERQLTAEERSTVTSSACDGVKYYFYQGDEPAPVIDLNGLKVHVRGRIDEQTKEAIYAGFTFDGVLFSMSENAQINWTNFPFLPESMFPLSIYGKNDDPYSLSFANKMPFYTAALTHKNTALQTGNYRKGQVNACTTVEQINTLAEGWNIVI